MNKKLVCLLFIFILLSFVTKAFAMQCSIAWSPGEIEETLGLGRTKDVSVTFVSSVTLNNVDLWVVPELQSLLSLDKTHFDIVEANVPYDVNLHFDIPYDIQTGLYDGTIHLRVGSKTCPQTLKVDIDVVTIIDFDNLEEGSHPTNTYEDLGVIISQCDPTYDPPVQFDFVVENVSGDPEMFPGASLPNVLTGHGVSPGPSGGFGCNYMIEMNFTRPIDFVSILSLSIWFESGTIRMIAYDEQESQLSEKSISVNQLPHVVPTFSQTLTMSESGISRVDLMIQGGVCAVFDDLTFN